MEGRGTAVFRHVQVLVTEKRMANGVRGRADHRGEANGMINEEAQRADKQHDREKEGRDREDRGRVRDGGDDAHRGTSSINIIRAPNDYSNIDCSKG